MYLTTHTSAGMLIGVLLPHPAAAFAAGVASHAVLDMIPHEPAEDRINTYPKDGEHSSSTIRRRISINLFDLVGVFCVIILGWFLSNLVPAKPDIFTGMIFGIVGSLLPDCIIMLTFFLDSRFLRWFFSVHYRIHFVISHVSVPQKLSIAYQLLFSCILIIISYLVIT